MCPEYFWSHMLRQYAENNILIPFIQLFPSNYSRSLPKIMSAFKFYLKTDQNVPNYMLKQVDD